MNMYDNMENEVLFVEAPGFLWCSGIDYGTEKIEVNEDAVRMLNKMTSESGIKRYLVVIVEKHFPSRELNAWSILRGLDAYIDKLILADSEEEIVHKVNQYIKGHHKISAFLFIGKRNMESYFPMRSVCTARDYLQERTVADAKRMLSAETRWGCFYSRMVGELGYHDLVEDEIEKVIFLDIDGVLNDDAKGPKIGEVYVERLSRIVKSTGAALILTSSWRWAYIQSMDTQKPVKNENINLLISTLDRYGMRIEGTTPIFFNGPNGRPFEVRTWLQRQADVKRFVILDDECFWQWNWLSDYFICTEHQTPEGKYVCGLTNEDVQKAVGILNR